MAKYRTRTLEVEAIHFDGTLEAAKSICENPSCRFLYRTYSVSDEGDDTYAVLVSPIERGLEATPGDWIILNGTGDFDVCTPREFVKTYELVEEND